MSDKMEKFTNKQENLCGFMILRRIEVFGLIAGHLCFLCCAGEKIGNFISVSIPLQIELQKMKMIFV